MNGLQCVTKSVHACGGRQHRRQSRGHGRIENPDIGNDIIIAIGVFLVVDLILDHRKVRHLTAGACRCGNDNMGRLRTRKTLLPLIILNFTAFL